MAPLRTIILPALAAVVAAQDLVSQVPECAGSCLTKTITENSSCETDDASCICTSSYSIKRNSEGCLRDACSESEYGEVMTGYDSFCENQGGAEPEPTSTYDTTIVPTTTSTTEEGYPTQPPPESEYPTSEPPESEYPTEAPPESEYPTQTPPESEYPTQTPPESEYPTQPPESDYPTEVPTSEPPEVPSSIIETWPTITDQPPPTEEPGYPTEAPPQPTEEPDYPTEAPPPPPGNTTFSTGYPTEEPPAPTEEPGITPVPTAGAQANFQLGSGAFIAGGLFAAGLAVFGF